MKKDINKILAIGQIPPPYNGQNVMFEYFVKGNYSKLKIYFINANFSSSLTDQSKLKIGKLIVILKIIYKSILYKFKYSINILYYLPSGSNKIALYKDIFLLFILRKLFSKTIYHIHAGGLSEYFNQYSFIERKMIMCVMGKPDLVIQLSKMSPADGVLLNAKKIVYIPNGITASKTKIQKLKDPVINLLYVGLIKESKGIFVLLEALRKIKETKFLWKMYIVGEFKSSVIKDRALNFIKRNGLELYVEFPGVKAGPDKEMYFAQADIFCFPSYFECENFPLVLLEAMQYGLPIVTTNWRAIPEIVIEEKTGFLVPIKNSEKLAIRLQELLENKKLREIMGSNGKKEFQKNYLLDIHLKSIEEAILNEVIRFY